MKIALIGNQNSGKTTLFNLLTGSNQKVGNWPGVTIEQKVGIIKGTDYEIVDLPGIYSLSPYTTEEEVSRNFVFTENPDLIINIIDATNIERSLYLTTMLLETNANVIVALNMTDILKKSGISINVKKLESLLKTSVVEISALKKTGIDELINLIKNGNYIKNAHQEIFPKDIEGAIERIGKHIEMPHPRFSIIKMLERDPKLSFTRPVEVDKEIKALEDKRDSDIESIIADERYNWIVEIKKQCTTTVPVKESFTKKIDKILLNKYLAIPIFLVIMALVYALSVGVVGRFVTQEISKGFSQLSNIVMKNMISSGSSEWSASLMGEGIIAGVGSVLSFLPQIIVLFICISILETTGYMSRIAFFFDRIFHKFGLSGKSLIPFIVGSGCTVPGIMTSRIVEDDKEKRMTVVLTPLMPCSAKLPVITMFASFIVGQNAGLAFLIAFSTYVLAIVLILLFALLLNKIYFKSDSNTFLSELPDYKAPSARYVGRDVLDKTLEFLVRAGTIILLFSIIVWFFLHFTWTFNYISTNSTGRYTIEDSMLAGIGKGFAWFFYPMTGGQAGQDTWAVAVAAIQGLVAREQVVSTMNIIAPTQEAFNRIFGFFQTVPITAVAFLFYCLYSAPCISSISATYKETGSFKKTLGIFLWQTGSAWVLASMIGGFGTLITLSIRGQL